LTKDSKATNMPKDITSSNNKMTIKYTNAADLASKIKIALANYVDVTIKKEDITLTLKDNDTRLQFEDATTGIIAKMGLKNINSAGNIATSIANKEFVESWYDSNKNDYNFAGNTEKYRAGINSEFSVIDSKDNEHKVFMAFVRTGFNEYAVEIYLPNQEEDPVSTTNIIKSGKITFDPKTGNGTPPANLKDITINFDVQGEVITSTFKLDWEKISMYGDIFNANITTDGKKEGKLVNTSVDKKGNLTVHYTNGDDKKLAALAVAMFKDPMKLQNEFGTVFSSTAESGASVLSIAGQNGAGILVSGSLEGSNVDEKKSMTELMKQQRFYSYNAKSYGIMNSMEDVLLSVIHA